MDLTISFCWCCFALLVSFSNALALGFAPFPFSLSLFSPPLSLFAGGHYCAYANHDVALRGQAVAGKGQWHVFDDSSVGEMGEDRVVSRGAYILVYKRRLARGGGGGAAAASSRPKATIGDGPVARDAADVAAGAGEEL